MNHTDIVQALLLIFRILQNIDGMISNPFDIRIAFIQRIDRIGSSGVHWQSRYRGHIIRYFVIDIIDALFPFLNILYIA